MNTEKHGGLLHAELSYQVRGAIFAIRKEYGPGQKETVYERLLEEKLVSEGLVVQRQKRLPIFSHASGKVVGTYIPDLLVADSLLVELKSSLFNSPIDEKQLYHYLRNSKYELGFLVNFSTEQLFIKRIIYTNDRKPFLRE